MAQTFPVADLEAAIGPISMRRLRDVILRTNTAGLPRLRERGLTWQQADAAALCAGLHPFQVWGDLWITAALEETGDLPEAVLVSSGTSQENTPLVF